MSLFPPACIPPPLEEDRNACLQALAADFGHPGWVHAAGARGAESLHKSESTLSLLRMIL